MTGSNEARKPEYPFEVRLSMTPTSPIKAIHANTRQQCFGGVPEVFRTTAVMAAGTGSSDCAGVVAADMSPASALAEWMCDRQQS